MSMKFSVIVPVFEQWHLVPQLLECLAEQSCPAESFEVLLVDNGSSELMIPDYMAPNVRVLHCGIRGAYAARNHGVRDARGEWLVFTDADCLPERGWLEELAAAAEKLGKDDTFFAGSIETVGSSISPSIYEIYDLVRGIPQARYVKRGYAATANLAVPRILLVEVQGFNDELYSGGDADFCFRAKSLGYELEYIDSAIVKHRVRTSWDAVATKARRVKGGQLTHKSARYKLWIYCRTILSPFISMYRLGGVSNHSIKYRLIAICVYLRVWTVEIFELFRIAFGKEPERR